MNDIWLFENDLVEYQNSDEGKAVGRLIEYNDYDVLAKKPGVPQKKLDEALEAYWNARNDTGLHFSNKEAQQKGKESDALEAKLYAEQN